MKNNQTKRGRPKTGRNPRKIRHFTARDAGRVVAYARRDGADDALLARYLVYSFGLGGTPFVIAKIITLTANVILYAAIFRLLKGIGYVIKGIKLLIKGDTILTVSVPFGELIGLIGAEFGLTFVYPTAAQWLILVGGIQASLASLVIYLDSLADNIIYFHFLDKVSDVKIENRPYRIIPKDFIE